MLLECKTCAAIVDANVIATYDDKDQDEAPGRWWFCSCPRCSLPMLAVVCDYGGGFDDDSINHVFPPAGRRQLGGAVPKNIRGAFDEAVVCFRAKAFTANHVQKDSRRFV